MMHFVNSVKNIARCLQQCPPWTSVFSVWGLYPPLNGLAISAKLCMTVCNSANNNIVFNYHLQTDLLRKINGIFTFVQIV